MASNKYLRIAYIAKKRVILYLALWYLERILMLIDWEV